MRFLSNENNTSKRKKNIHKLQFADEINTFSRNTDNNIVPVILEAMIEKAPYRRLILSFRLFVLTEQYLYLHPIDNKLHDFRVAV